MNKHNNGGARRRMSVGFFIDSLNSGYQISIWQGVVAAARDMDINLFCFLGDMLKSPTQYHDQRNVLYDLVSKKRIDGLLILTGTIGTYINLEEMTRFCKQYNLPVVSIGLDLDDIPGIVIDNYQGMYDLVSHLVKDHHYRKIAFLHKQENHQEGKQRFRAYRDVLAHNGIIFNPDFVIPGTYYAQPHKQVAQLLEKGINEIEAIVAFDDFTAIPVIKLLHDRNISVPDDIAIVGFDDISESKFLHLPLTTVRQPLFDQGHKSVEVMYDMLSGRDVPEQVCMPGTLVIRQTCGCMSGTVAQAVASTLAETSESIVSILERKYDTLAEEMNQALTSTPECIDVSIDSCIVYLLLQTLIEDVKAGFDGSFISLFDKVCRETMHHGGDVSTWHRIISVLYKNTLPYVYKSKELLGFENMWQQCHILINEVAQSSRGFIRLEAERQARIVQGISYAQVTCFTMDELLDVTARELPKIGINSCYLSLYNRKGMPASLSRLIMAYNESGRMEIHPKENIFLSKELVPYWYLPAGGNQADGNPAGCDPGGDMLDRDGGNGNSLDVEFSGEDFFTGKRYTFVICPLLLRKDHLGFVLYEVGPLDGTIYEALHTQLSVALKQVMLLDEHKKSEQTLELYAQELESSNDELQQFAYMASHDLQEPLRMVTNYLQLIEKRYIQHLDAQAHEFIGFAVDGASRMSHLISDLLLYSRVGTRKKPFKEIASETVVNKVIANLRFAIEESGAIIVKDFLPVVFADETQLMQLFQNLIGNAIKFRGERPPRIEIAVEKNKNKWLFSLKDNGIGIDPQFGERIFMIFQRLHCRDDYSGTGIGLAICKKIVERHNGEIWLDPGSKNGAHFHFTLPMVTHNP